MKRFIGLMVLGVALVGYVALGEEPSNARPAKSAKTESVHRGIEQIEAQSQARVSVDVADESFLGLTVVDRAGNAMSLSLVPNKMNKGWAPALPEGTKSSIFGTGLEKWLLIPPKTAAGDGKAQRKMELQPLDSSIADVSADNVSVFVVDENLVLVGVLERGQIVGVYFVVNMDVEMEGQDDGAGGVALGAPVSPRDDVCRILLDQCLNQRSEYWIFSCGLWLYFCAAV